MRPRALVAGTAAFTFLLLVTAACHRPSDTVQSVASNAGAAISEVRFHCASMGGMMSYRIVIPPPQSGPVRVLYFLQGANSSAAEIMRNSDIERLAVSAHIVVVLPDADDSYYTNAKHKLHARWEDAITTDLTRDVASRFHIAADRAHTGIAGISMGGYGATKLALKHPDLYGFSASMSGALDITRRRATMRRSGQTWRIWTIFGFLANGRVDEDVFELLNHASAPQQTVWFASCGRNDPLHAIDEKFVRELRARGARVNLITTPGGHDWQSWEYAIPLMFEAANEQLR